MTIDDKEDLLIGDDDRVGGKPADPGTPVGGGNNGNGGGNNGNGGRNNGNGGGGGGGMLENTRHNDDADFNGFDKIFNDNDWNSVNYLNGAH